MSDLLKVCMNAPDELEAIENRQQTFYCLGRKTLIPQSPL